MAKKSKESIDDIFPQKDEDIAKFLDNIDPFKKHGSKAYRGNSLLKRAGEKFEWNEIMLKEWIKCSQDPIYFIETYVKIIHLDKGRMTFKLRDYQKDMVKTMHEHRFSILATARQVGKSTTTCAYILWYILFHKDKCVALLANKGETAREILGKIRLAYSLLPKWIQAGIVEGGWNKGSINLENGSMVFATATSSDAVRGYAINLLFLDEVAHVEGWEQFEASVLPTISSSETSKVIMVSTPNGMNHFNKYWVLANKEHTDEHWNGYWPVRVSWEQVPGRDMQWYKDILNTMSGNLDKFNQEYGVEFLGSSDTLIAGWKLKNMVHETPIHYDQGLSQYIAPQEDHLYIVTADVSHGKGLDDSAFHVIDITEMPFRIAATFKSNQTVPYEFTDIMQKTAQSYNKAYILVENNDIGKVVTQLLQVEFMYEWLLYSGGIKGGKNGKTLTAGFSGNAEIGVGVTKLLKIQGCSLLKLLIEGDKLLVPDLSTIEELSTFIRKGPSYQAEEGKKDDLVMALVIFAWATDQAYFKDLSNINAIQHVRDKTDQELEEALIPFGILDYSAAEEATKIEKRRNLDMLSDAWQDSYRIIVEDNNTGYREFMEEHANELDF